MFKSSGIDVLFLKLIKNGNKLAGYGFAEFSSEQEASRVFQIYNGQPIPSLPGKIYKLNRVGNKTRATTRKIADDNCFQIYVAGLPVQVDHQALLNMFREYYDSVFEAKVIVCQTDQISKGYGFVNFTNLE